jgi:predicted O-methyltransferase YrrM
MFSFPKHFKYPENERIWFTDHIPVWNEFLKDRFNKKNICLEIGAYYGASTVYIREQLCNTADSHLYVMDINMNSFLTNNIEPYDNITFMQGESRDSFKKFNHNGIQKEFLDFVYIDGSHLCVHVLEDAVNAFYCLKDGGIMIFDDYLGGLEQERHLQVKTGVDAFIYTFNRHLIEIHSGYQLILMKKEYFEEEEYRSNYYSVSK